MSREINNQTDHVRGETMDSQAKKYDAEKSRMDLIPPMPLVAIGGVFGYGAQKYGAGNYLQGGGLEHSRLYAAVQRHLTAYWSGVDVDEESGLPHLAHAAASLLMLMTSRNDDRLDWGSVASKKGLA